MGKRNFAAFRQSAAVDGNAPQYEANYEHKMRGQIFANINQIFIFPSTVSTSSTSALIAMETPRLLLIEKDITKTWNGSATYTKKHQTRLIETYHYELTEGILQQSLEQKLKDFGVKFNRRTDEKMLEELRKFGAVSALAEFLAKLLKTCKRDGICPAELQPENFPGVDPNQLQQTRTILSFIYELYQNHLKENQEIDFDDMIHKAINYVESGRFAPPWQYILVDEFQDISEPRAKLVKALKKSAGECSLVLRGRRLAIHLSLYR